MKKHKREISDIYCIWEELSNARQIQAMQLNWGKKMKGEF